MQIFCKYDPSAGNSGPWKNQASVEVTRNGKTETKKSNETTTEIPFRKITTEVVNGTITPSDTKVKVGTDKKIDYSPKEGYFLTSVAVDGKEVDQAKYPSTYSFTNVQADHTIKVVYSPNPTKQVVDNKGSDINGKLRHPCNMYQTDICFDQKQRFCQGKRGVDMKKAAILILRFIMVPFRLVIHVMAAIAWLAVRLSSIIVGPVIALLGVLAVFCAAHQEWRNVVILLILGGAIYVAYFLAGNVLARAGSL